LVRRTLFPTIRKIDVWVRASWTRHSQLPWWGAPDPRLVMSVACSLHHLKEHPFMNDTHELLIAVLNNDKDESVNLDRKTFVYLDCSQPHIVRKFVKGLIEVKPGDLPLKIHHRE